MLKCYSLTLILPEKHLKLRKYFLIFKTKKLKISKKIISRENKSKLRLNMTMKGLSRKQVIVPMNSENSSNFMKNSSFHITNISKALKNIKSDIIANFICVDNRDMIITTIFFFYNQQFITWHSVADHGSYFRNYVQRKHTNME